MPYTHTHIHQFCYMAWSSMCEILLTCAKVRFHEWLHKFTIFSLISRTRPTFTHPLLTNFSRALFLLHFRQSTSTGYQYADGTPPVHTLTVPFFNAGTHVVLSGYTGCKIFIKNCSSCFQQFPIPFFFYLFNICLFFYKDLI
jgi:hypothetical protein